jgi:16S rRNA C1402 (ribose-2'-O) methylase RsmI
MTDDVERQLHEMYLAGATAKEAVATIAGETGLKKKELYQTWLRLDKVWKRKTNTRKIK